MKKFVSVLLGSAMAFAIAPGALADPIKGSVAVAGIDEVSFNSTSGSSGSLGTASSAAFSSTHGAGQLDSYSSANAGGKKFIDLTEGLGSSSSFSVEGPVEESIVNGVLTISGSGILTGGGQGSAQSLDFSLDSHKKRNDGGINSVAAPEPSSLLLLGTGFLGLALVAFWKGKSSRPVGNR